MKKSNNCFFFSFSYFSFVRHDAARISHLFGISDNLLPHTVTKNPRAAVVHGFSRLTAKYAIYAEKMDVDETAESDASDNATTGATKRQSSTLILSDSCNAAITGPTSKHPRLTI